MNIINFLKLSIGIIILLGITIGAYKLGDLSCQYIGIKDAFVIAKWFIGICLETFIFVFFFIAYKIGDLLINHNRIF